MKFSELRKQMSAFNKKHGIERKACEKYKDDKSLIEMKGRVVLSNKVMVKEFSEKERTYEFSNYNKALTSGDLGYSIFAVCKATGDVARIERMSDKDIESAEIVFINE